MRMLHPTLLRLMVAGLLASGFATAATANTLPFAYSYDNPHQFGTKKAETYDIAIRIPGNEFKDYVITGFSVPLAGGEGFDNVSAWMSSALELVDKVNAPDIVSVEGTVTDGILAVEFPESYTVPAKGVYVGYSFTITEVPGDTQKYPVTVTDGVNPDGFYTHTSRTFRKWSASSERDQCCSAMKVYFEGDFAENSARIDALDNFRCGVGQAVAVPATVANLGANAIESLTFNYRVGTENGTSTYELPLPVEPGLGYKAKVELPLPVELAVGTYDVEVELTQVNGAEIAEGSQTPRDARLRVISFVPRRYPLVEEYTGTWCQFCPRGFAAMERMGTLYPDDFICIVYHDDDVMQTFDFYPGNPPGLPKAFVDRQIMCDPYFGIGEEDFGIEQVWLQQRDVFTPGQVKVSAAWTDATMENIAVTATALFAEDPERECGISYVLCENGLCGTGSRWAQKNAYSGSKNTFIPEMDVFCQGGEYVEGLKFNEVALRSSAFSGVEGSLPEVVSPDVEYSHTFTFSNVSAITNVKGDVIMQDKKELFVVGLLVDCLSGEVLNAAKCDISDNSGMAVVAADTDAVSVTYFTLDGRLASGRHAGILLEKTEYSNGAVAWRKVVGKE